MGDALSTDGSGPSGLGLPSRGLDDLPGLQAEAPDVLRGAGDEPAPGSGGDEGELGALARAAAIRFPDLRGMQGLQRINALVEHINLTAIARGDLEELRLEANTRLLDLRARLARVPSILGKSKTAADEARRASNPDLAQQIDTARWTVDRCTEQITRMGGTEYDAASRTYTLVSGT